MQRCLNFYKKRTNNWKNTKLCQNHSDCLYKSQTIFQCHGLLPSWVIRLSMAAFVYLVIFFCCFTDFDKNGTNNWKVTKLLASTFEHWDKLQPKFQCRSFITFWVIRLCLIYIYIYMPNNYALFKKLMKMEQTIKKVLNFT